MNNEAFKEANKHVVFVGNQKYDGLNPDIRAEHEGDFLSALSRIIRYNGSGPFSVLAHSVIMAQWALKNGRPDVALLALYHDFAEAITGDLAWCSKSIAGQGWKEWEYNIDTTVLRAFWLPFVESKLQPPDTFTLKTCLDSQFCKAERFLMGHPDPSFDLSEPYMKFILNEIEYRLWAGSDAPDCVRGVWRDTKQKALEAP